MLENSFQVATTPRFPPVFPRSFHSTYLTISILHVFLNSNFRRPEAYFAILSRVGGSLLQFLSTVFLQIQLAMIPLLHFLGLHMVHLPFHPLAASARSGFLVQQVILFKLYGPTDCAAEFIRH